MRNTGNRGLEATHGMFRGGTTSLPITSPNLSFSEFSVKMNKANQIHTAEHQLKQIPGNTVVSSKKKRQTNAHRSMTDQDHTHKYTGYTKPGTFELFLTELNNACNEGDEAAKRAIEELAPDIAVTTMSGVSPKPVRTSPQMLMYLLNQTEIDIQQQILTL